MGSFPVGHSTGAGCVNCLQKFRAARWLQRDSLGPWTWCEARRGLTSVRECKREKERHSDMGKLDPEREIAGGKVLVLLPGLQVRQQLSD